MHLKFEKSDADDDSQLLCVATPQESQRSGYGAVATAKLTTVENTWFGIAAGAGHATAIPALRCDTTVFVRRAICAVAATLNRGMRAGCRGRGRADGGVPLARLGLGGGAAGGAAGRGPAGGAEPPPGRRQAAAGRVSQVHDGDLACCPLLVAWPQTCVFSCSQRESRVTNASTHASIQEKKAVFTAIPSQTSAFVSAARSSATSSSLKTQCLCFSMLKEFCAMQGVQGLPELQHARDKVHRPPGQPARPARELGRVAARGEAQRGGARADWAHVARVQWQSFPNTQWGAPPLLSLGVEKNNRRWRAAAADDLLLLVAAAVFCLCPHDPLLHPRRRLSRRRTRRRRRRQRWRRPTGRRPVFSSAALAQKRAATVACCVSHESDRRCGLRAPAPPNKDPNIFF